MGPSCIEFGQQFFPHTGPQAAVHPRSRRAGARGAERRAAAAAAYWLSARSTFLRLLPSDFTARLTSAALAPVFFASYATSCRCLFLRLLLGRAYTPAS